MKRKRFYYSLIFPSLRILLATTKASRTASSFADICVARVSKDGELGNPKQIAEVESRRLNY